MRTLSKITVLAAAMLIAPALTLAASQGSTPSKSTQTKSSKPAAPATHATTGVVKSVDDTSLVVSKPGNKDPKKDMSFTLTSSTEKKGTLAAGAAVQVRYKTENGKNIATAVTVTKKAH